MMSRILILYPCSVSSRHAHIQKIFSGGGGGGGRGLALDHEGSDSFTISKPIPWEIEGVRPPSGFAHG